MSVAFAMVQGNAINTATNHVNPTILALHSRSLGIDNTYFLAETPQNISDHILALYGAKVLAFTKHDPSKLTIDLERVTSADQAGKGGQKEGAIFIHSSVPGVKAVEGPGAVVEKR